MNAIMLSFNPLQTVGYYDKYYIIDSLTAINTRKTIPRELLQITKRTLQFFLEIMKKSFLQIL